MEPSFPVNEFLAEHVVAGVTVRQTPRSWVAALILKDPKTGIKTVRIYDWKKSPNDERWKRRGAVTLDKAEQIRSLMGALEKFSHEVAESQLNRLKGKIDGRHSRFKGGDKP